MAPNTTQKMLIGSACVAVIALAFVVGYSLRHDKGGSGTPAPKPDAAATDAPAQTPSVVVVAPAVAANDVPAARNSSTPPIRAGAFKTVDLTDWQFARNGCDVEQNGSAIHVAGINNVDGWDNKNGVTTNTSYPVQDFELSADLIMPKFRGPGQSIITLQAKEANSAQINLQYFVQGNVYVLRWWYNKKQEFSKTTLPRFGDEARAYHRLKLKYDATTHRATGWADDRLIGSVEFELKSDLRFVMAASSEKMGNDIDLTFDHPTLILAGNSVGALEKLP